MNIGTDENPRELQIGANLSPSEAARMVAFLTEYQDVFAWSYADMPGLDPKIVEHRVPTDPLIPPVKQKLRRYKPELVLKIKEEVEKLIKVEFIEVSQYPTWSANIVPVIKKNGQVRVRVDY